METDNKPKREFKRSTKKKGRKFIQIVVTGGGTVYALDMAGRVWMYQSYNSTWSTLGETRI